MSAVTSQAVPKTPQATIRAICDNQGGLVDLWEASPVRVESNTPQTEKIIDALFPGNPLLCCGWSKHRFDTRPRANWYKMGGLQFIVPNPMTAKMGKTQQGKLSEHTKENTGPRRFLVIEQDQGEIDEQAAILLHLATIAPMALALHSGGKSLHGWFYFEGVPEQETSHFMKYAASLGADPATWTLSQFVRLPDGTRDNGKRQAIYFFNPEVIP
jgi:hypothetical protein